MPRPTGTATPMEADLEYLGADGRPLPVRVYRPTGPGPFPAAIEVHGGAWNGLDHLADEELNRELARRQILVAAVEFRQGERGRYPLAVRDITAALEWLAARRDEYGLSSIGFIGNSSGGHQALLTALLPGDARFAVADPPTAADFLVLLWPVIDPRARYYWALGPGGRPDLAGRHLPFWGDVAAMSDGNPYDIVASRVQRHLPRVLAIQGSADENLPPQMLPAFVEAYRASGGEITAWLAPGEGHNFMIRDFDRAASRHAVDLVADFIRADQDADS